MYLNFYIAIFKKKNIYQICFNSNTLHIKVAFQITGWCMTVIIRQQYLQYVNYHLHRRLQKHLNLLFKRVFNKKYK